MRRAPARLFERLTGREAPRLADALRTETVGGMLLLGGAALALVLVNCGLQDFYERLSDYEVGGSPFGLHLRLSLSAWAADGLLAIFFFVAGLELKRELVVGELRDPRKAALPVVAAACGVAVPALLFLLVTLGSPGAARGWAIPTATDIAFALAVLGIVGSHLPSGLRAFLLTLAVVDDLIAIAIIAVFYTSSLSIGYLAAALVPMLLFAVLTRKRWPPQFTVPALMACAVVAWALVHESGVHATVAGVTLGLLVPVSTDPDDTYSADLEHRVRPISAGFAVPVFAFFASGVALGSLRSAASDPVAIGVVVGLVVGKPVGVFGGTWLTARFTGADLAEDLTWSDAFGVSVLAGVGFTVSLLIGELAFGPGTPRDDDVKVAVLTASLIAAILASMLLRRRNAVYRAMD